MCLSIPLSMTDGIQTQGFRMVAGVCGHQNPQQAVTRKLACIWHARLLAHKQPQGTHSPPHSTSLHVKHSETPLTQAKLQFAGLRGH